MSESEQRPAAEDAADIKKREGGGEKTVEQPSKEGDLSKEREAIKLEFTQAEQLASEAASAVVEAEKFAEAEDNNLDPEVRADIAGLKEEARVAAEKLEQVRARLAEIDQQLEDVGTSEVLTEAVIEAPKKEITSEDSKAAMYELVNARIDYSTYSLSNELNSHDGPISTQSVIDGNNKRTNYMVELAGKLHNFENRTLNITDVEKPAVELLLDDAKKQTIGVSNHDGKPYNQKGETIVDSRKKRINSLISRDKISLEKMKAEIALIEGNDTSENVDAPDFQKLKKDLELLRPEDRQELLVRLQDRASTIEANLQKAEAILKRDDEDLKTLEPALRTSERNLFNALRDVDTLAKKLRKDFFLI